MSYRLCMSPSQIARCNRALGTNALATTTVRHEWPGVTPHDVDVVLLDAAGIRSVIVALQANPEDIGPDDNSLEWIDLDGLEEVLFLTLQEPEDDGMLHGICI